MIHIKEKPYLISPQSFQEFIHSLGFMDFDTWDESAWHPVVEAALSCWQKGIPCFSQAYCPSKAWRKRERSAARNPRLAVGRGLARALFQEGDGKGRKGWCLNCENYRVIKRGKPGKLGNPLKIGVSMGKSVN